MQRVLLVVIVALAALVGVQRVWRQVAASGPGATAPTRSAATPSAPVADPAPGSQPPVVELLTANQLAALVRRYPSPTVLVLYGTNSLLSRQLMPGLEQIASRHRAEGLLVHAVDTDPDSAQYDVPQFLRTTSTTFPALRLAGSGDDLARALASAGSEVIRGDSAYTLPVVVVWDRTGKVVAQAQGMADADELERVVSGVLAQAR